MNGYEIFIGLLTAVFDYFFSGLLMKTQIPLLDTKLTEAVKLLASIPEVPFSNLGEGTYLRHYATSR
jgi:hypothetical protein